MFPLSLAPTSAPKRWYSNQHSIQDEFDELAYMEAKFVHDREQALEVHCPMIIPPSTNVNNSNNIDHSLDDPSMDDIPAHDDINGSDMVPSEVDVAITNDRTINSDDHDGDAPGSINRSMSFISQPSDAHAEQPPSSQHQYYNSRDHSYHRRSSSTYTPGLVSMGSYTTPNRMTITSNMQFSFLTSTTPIRTAHQQGNPSLVASPDLAQYISSPPSPPLPAGRSLRQYMDESSRRFMEPEIMDRLIRYDDDDDSSPPGSTQSQHHNNSSNNDEEGERRRLWRSNPFE